MNDFTCPICSIWFCDSKECATALSERERNRKRDRRGRPYTYEPGRHAQYYEANREKKIESAKLYQKQNKTWKKRDRREYFRERYRSKTARVESLVG